MVICGCKKEEPVNKQYGFSINGEGNFHNTPFAYVRKEGYDSKKNIYYLSLTFPTGAVVMDTVSKNFKGYGEAPLRLTEINPIGKDKSIMNLGVKLGIVDIYPSGMYRRSSDR